MVPRPQLLCFCTPFQIFHKTFILLVKLLGTGHKSRSSVELRLLTPSVSCQNRVHKCKSWSQESSDLARCLGQSLLFVGSDQCQKGFLLHNEVTPRSAALTNGIHARSIVLHHRSTRFRSGSKLTTLAPCSPCRNLTSLNGTISTSFQFCKRDSFKVCQIPGHTYNTHTPQGPGPQLQKRSFAC